MKIILITLLTLICMDLYGQNNQNSSLMGLWQMNTETIEFKTNNQVIYLGQTYQFTTEGNVLSIITNQGPLQMYYSVSANKLTLSANNQSLVYTKIDKTTTNNTNINNGTQKGIIAQEIVGKWCNMGGSSSNAYISSHSECIVIYANGTYEYSYDGGTSVSTGSVASNNYDRGTWRLDGNSLYVNSQKQGPLVYTFEKRNNKNNDPMLVIGGKEFVTYHNRPAW